MNPFQGLASFFLGVLEQRTIQKWASLIFQMAFSAGVSFLYVCSAALIAGGTFKFAIGSGMGIMAIVLTVFFRTSPLTKNMMAVLPESEAKSEIETNLQVIGTTKVKE